MRKKIFFIAIVFAILFFSGCGKQKPQICGNGKCEPNESIETCSLDCKKIDQNHPEIDKNQPNFENNELPALGVFALRANGAAELGVEWSRLPSANWSRIEPSKNQFNWKESDAELSKPLNRVISLRFDAQWAINCNETSQHGDFVPQKKSCAPKNEQDLRDFVKAVASRYSCKGIYWQIENEPYGQINNAYWAGTMQDLINVTKIATEEIRKNDKCSNGKIILAGIANGQANFKIKSGKFAQEQIEQARKEIQENIKTVMLGTKDYFDIIDLHLYLETEPNVQETIELVKEFMKETGNENKQIFITESAMFFFGAPESATNEEQAKDISKRTTLEYANGASLSLYMLYKDAGENSVDACTARCGLFNSELNPKPQYYAFRQFAEKITGFKKVEKLDSPSQTSVYRYDNGTIIAWAEENGTYDLSWALNSEKVELEKIALTESVPEKETVFAKKIPLTTDALYITISG